MSEFLRIHDAKTTKKVRKLLKCKIEETHGNEFHFILFFYYVHIPSSKIIKKDNGTEIRMNVTTIEQGLHRHAAGMVEH